MTSPADWPDPPLVPERRVFFETHIRPMFRLVDIDHMLFKVSPSKTLDLTSYDEVVKKAPAIDDDRGAGRAGDAHGDDRRRELGRSSLTRASDSRAARSS